MTATAAFALMLDLESAVASSLASRRGRPIAVERCSIAWATRDAEAATPEDWERVLVVGVGEDPVGACKRYYGSRKDAPSNLVVADPRCGRGSAPPPTGGAEPEARALEPQPSVRRPPTQRPAPGPSRQLDLFGFGD